MPVETGIQGTDSENRTHRNRHNGVRRADLGKYPVRDQEGRLVRGRNRGPRLYLDPKRKQWVIRDGAKFKRTGCGEADYAKAEEILARYVSGTRRWKTGFVYFLTCEAEDFPIKIGISANPGSRVADLQPALPYRIKLLAAVPGTTADEMALHIKFKHLHMHGEWFRRDNELMQFVRAIARAARRALHLADDPGERPE